MRHSATLLAAAAIWVLTASQTPGAPAGLLAGFENPPEQTKPWCYYYWISDNISKEGITRDLEAMKRAGIGEALIGNIFLDDIPAGKTRVLTPEWWALIEHAIREGGRVGVNIGMFNCPGWSQSGGPWITPGQSMRRVAFSETRVTGPASLNLALPAPEKQFQDIGVFAFPAPQNDADTLGRHSPRITSSPAGQGLEALADGNETTAFEFPAGAARGGAPFRVEFETAEPFTARSLQIVPAREAFGADCELQAAGADGVFASVRQFKCDRSNMGPGVGFMPRGPVTISFPAVTARQFRVIFTGFFGGRKAELAEIKLSGAARLESFVEKQLGKMHPTPLPMWDTYLWPTQAEPESGKFAVPAGAVRDLTKNLGPGGVLRWEAPPGDWVILRTGMTPTGMKNSPASPEGQGLEVDKMNRALARRHFDAFIGQLVRRMPASERKAFTRVVADSYEMGSQNWTDGFDVQFLKCYGYDPKPWLPVLSGRLVESADQSERFLWDLRRLVADRVATDYVGGLREASNERGLGLWLENYGHWGFPSEFLKYGSQSDRIGGEYWVTGDLGSIECRAASSCANTYGKAFVSAESFTGGPPFQTAPGGLKARGDWAFCEGINHFVLHVWIQQPWEDKVPGVNAWFGTEFNRHNTWFDQSKSWVDYLRRCCWMLQQGTRVADAAYFIGEDAPKMTGVRKPELPPGRDFDYINAEVIEHGLAVRDGWLALPHGTTYRVLVLPELATMRPAVLRKIRALVNDGATVYGTPPSRSPSLENYPKCDEQVRELAAGLWGGADVRQPGQRVVGKGRLVWGQPLSEVFASLGSTPDFECSVKLRYTHRRAAGADIYFVANPKSAPLTVTAAFRAEGKSPELWQPDTGLVERPAVFDADGGIVRLPLSFGPHGSVFVVFRDTAPAQSPRIVSVARQGTELLGTKAPAVSSSSAAESPNNFTIALWVKPAADTPLTRQSASGVVGMGDKRNDIVLPPHGSAFGGAGHAGCGLAAGRNGLAVFEHGANYFAPTLVHAAVLDGWTHVTVAYRDGQPSLYLNGLPARTGLKSQHIVHWGGNQSADAQFRGRAGGIEYFPRTLTEAEAAALTKTMPCPADQAVPPPVFTVDAQGRVQAEAADAGDYELTFAGGAKSGLHIGPIPPAITLAGPWDVRFTRGWGAPEQLVFDALVDWTQHPDAGVKHYSGKAVYRKTFDLPAVQPGARLVLDLGEVRDTATVRVNGQEHPALWHAPWRVDITGAARSGANVLEIVVANPWNNRLAADAALPARERLSFIIAPTVSKNTPLLPAGLIGPVTVISTAKTPVPGAGAPGN